MSSIYYDSKRDIFVIKKNRKKVRELDPCKISRSMLIKYLKRVKLFNKRKYLIHCSNVQNFRYKKHENHIEKKRLINKRYSNGEYYHKKEIITIPLFFFTSKQLDVLETLMRKPIKKLKKLKNNIIPKYKETISKIKKDDGYYIYSSKITYYSKQHKITLDILEQTTKRKKLPKRKLIPLKVDEFQKLLTKFIGKKIRDNDKEYIKKFTPKKLSKDEIYNIMNFNREKTSTIEYFGSPTKIVIYIIILMAVSLFLFNK